MRPARPPPRPHHLLRDDALKLGAARRALLGDEALHLLGDRGLQRLGRQRPRGGGGRVGGGHVLPVWCLRWRSEGVVVGEVERLRALCGRDSTARAARGAQRAARSAQRARPQRRGALCAAFYEAPLHLQGPAACTRLRRDTCSCWSREWAGFGGYTSASPCPRPWAPPECRGEHRDPPTSS